MKINNMNDEKLYKGIRENVHTYMKQAVQILKEMGSVGPSDIQVIEIAKMIQLEAIHDDKTTN